MQATHLLARPLLGLTLLPGKLKLEFGTVDLQQQKILRKF
jgi:hypothetical protein